MASLTQILNYVESHKVGLVQADAAQNDEAAMNNVPDVFVPIYGKEIAPEDIKYVMAMSHENEEKRIFRIIAIKDFCRADGKMVYKGEVGGYADVQTYLGQNDASWVENGCSALGSRIIGDSLICNQSDVYKAKVADSLIDNCTLQNVVTVTGSRLCRVDAEESCTVKNSELNDTIMIDRAHVEDSKADNCQLNFCWISDALLKDEKIIGNSAGVEMAKVHHYNSAEKASEPEPVAKAPGRFWEFLRRTGFSKGL